MSIESGLENLVHPFIVDNANADAKVLHCVRAWCDDSAGLDIATGTFEIGALLALDENWNKLREIRILMGGDVSLRTKREFDRAFGQIVRELDKSLEDEKNRNDFLDGV